MLHAYKRLSHIELFANETTMMAEGLDPKEPKGLDDLEQEITCLICNERFQNGREPKMLPCGHCYCKLCIHQLAAREHPFPCPECRTATVLPKNGSDQLPTLYLLNRIKDVHAKLEQGKLEVVCESCGKAKVEAFCRQCTEFICKECKQCHQKMKLKFSGHELVMLEDLKKGQAKRKRAPPPMCEEHDEPMKFFCFDCDRLICSVCRNDRDLHPGHKCKLARKAAPECKKELQEGLASLRIINADITEVNKQAEAVEKEASDRATAVSSNIRQSFEYLHEILYRREQELLTKASKLLEQKVKALKSQTKNFQIAIAEIFSLADFVEHELENATDEELVSHHKSTLDKLDKGKKHSQLYLNLEDTSVSVRIRCAEGLTDLCQRNAQVICCPVVDPSKCKAVVFSTEVGMPTQFIVYTKCPHNELCSESQVVNAGLKTLVGDSFVQCEVCDKEGGVYEVSYTPKTRGRHILTVTVNGKEIDGSPFQVFVKIHPNKLGEPVSKKTIARVNWPWGMVFNTKQQLLVAEYSEKRVLVIDEDGNKLKTIRHQLFEAPSGVAADKDNNVYVTDSKVNILLKFNKDGELLSTVGGEGIGLGQFNDPGMIRIIDDELYVCDRNNYRIQILDLDLKFRRSFGSMGSGNGKFERPQDVIQDSSGNIYVADSHRIHVFDCNFQFQFAFAEKELTELSNFTGLCFDSNQFLFVANYTTSCVLVFQPNGEFVTSFAATHVTRPSGIAIDEDGFVYVRHKFIINAF